MHSSDLERANGALSWVESKEKSTTDFVSSTQDYEPLDEIPALPYVWDANEATSEVWSGEDESVAEYLASALRENGIPSRIPDEPGHRARLCVRAQDLSRARAIARQIAEG